MYEVINDWSYSVLHNIQSQFIYYVIILIIAICAISAEILSYFFNPRLKWEFLRANRVFQENIKVFKKFIFKTKAN